LIPRADEYQGEYIPDSANRLRWMSGFTGSAGIAVVLADKAAVLSDGRYTIQLGREIDAGVFETGDITKQSAGEWIVKNAPDALIGYDPKLHTPREIAAFKDRGIELKPLSRNPVDAVWEGRPEAPASPVENFPLEYAGHIAAEKLEALAMALKESKAEAAIISLSDSIAWLLNIRARDIAHIPVALSYGIAYDDGSFDWFIDEKRVGGDVREALGRDVRIHPPAMLEEKIAALRGRAVLLDERRASVWFAERLDAAGAKRIDEKDPVILFKARKNRAEQAAMRAAHLRDGVAVTKFLHWFARESVREKLTELDVEQKLEAFRKEAPEYREASFDTIAGFGANGAIVHYRATPETNALIERWNLLLLDSGAQYADGTTDITRTMAVGAPSEEMRENYTAVLKGHIAVASARFPEGTTGAQIDALARAPLWQRGLDYAHGTGHGVGCYLSVHEESASISPRGQEALRAGMILSNEPGYYKEGAYGIRLENLLLVREDGICAATGRKMLCFETLTLAPFDKALIVPELLSADEAFWLASYHKAVFAELSPYLDEEARAWLGEQVAAA